MKFSLLVKSGILESEHGRLPQALILPIITNSPKERKLLTEAACFVFIQMKGVMWLGSKGGTEKQAGEWTVELAPCHLSFSFALVSFLSMWGTVDLVAYLMLCWITAQGLRNLG